jgi:glycosyltransferase involved in cell wall biosynthesis
MKKQMWTSATVSAKAEQSSRVVEREQRRRAKEQRAKRPDDDRSKPATADPQRAWKVAPTQPAAVIAAPLFNKADYLRRALESLLAQSHENFALLLVDDASTDETPAIVESFVARDARVFSYRNAKRLGMIGNKRNCFALARELFPDAPYFAWGSDHDLWRTDWLAALIAALDGSPHAVLAYPKSIRIDEHGAVIRRPWEFETAGLTEPRQRLRASCEGVVSGSMVYGLYRADALARVGVMRDVLEPDRLLLLELSLLGEFVQLPEVLWERRFRGLASLPRQRASLFADNAPWYTRLTPWLAHAWIMFWSYAVRGAGKPEVGRLRGLGLSFEFVRSTIVTRTRRRIRKERDLRHRKRRAARASHTG